MGFLSDLGRSGGVGQLGQNFLTGVLQAGQFVQNAETHRLTQQKAQMDMEKAQKEQEHLDQTVDFRLSPFYLSLPDEAKPTAEKMFQSSGAVDSNFRGKRRDMFSTMGEIEKSKGAFETLTKPIIDAKHNIAVKAYGKLAKAQAAGDEKAIAQAQADFNVARANAETSKGEYFKHLDALSLEEAKSSYKPILKNVPGVGLVQVNPKDASADILVPADQGEKSQSEEQLTRKALAGDKEAQAILNAMQARKVETAKAGASAQQEAKMEGMDLNSLASSMKQGQMASEHVRNAFGVPIQGKVETLVRKELPNFDFIKNDANAKWQYNPGNQRTIAMTEAALPRLLRLDEQVTSLGNTTIPKINEVMRIVARETGRPEYTNFEANRNAIVQEINTALSGSATSSDMRIRIELENIQSARSPAQLSGAIHNLREALLSRLDTSLSVPYPMEVVRGEKTIAEYKTELFKKYRGNYGISDGETQTGGNSKFKIISVK